MCGPEYVSEDYYRDVYPAPDGFEQNTYFVHGGTGELANYSIILYRGCLNNNKIDDIPEAMH